MVASGCKVAEVPGEEGDAGPSTTGEVQAEITGMLQASAASWNAGDLDGFLDDYWNSDELTFSGATGVTRGWDDVRQRYLRSYWAPGVSRDSLRFEDTEVLPLGSDHALALGRYVLFRPGQDGETVSGTGYFSLVLLRTAEGWKIIHDHTSATPPPEGEG
jgi:beta-aspartyl-peptidase (threonine type)